MGRENSKQAAEKFLKMTDQQVFASIHSIGTAYCELEKNMGFEFRWWDLDE